jgi:hypothetical protein
MVKKSDKLAPPPYQVSDYYSMSLLWWQIPLQIRQCFLLLFQQHVVSTVNHRLNIARQRLNTSTQFLKRFTRFKNL